jgi:thiosulfate reductase cytochrome b subunit
MQQVMMYNRFERLWHWSSALLIICMLITGFEIHGTYTLLGFEMAVNTHIIAAWTLIGLGFLAVFWHMVTGEWRQYIPSSANKLIAMVKYYGIDIFLGGGHPHHKTRKEKLNPMQRVAYLSLHVMILPFSVLSGLLYFFYPYWGNIGLGDWSLLWIALIHTALAFVMLAFLIVHLYLALTTSEEPLGYLKAMISGYEKE